MELKENIVDGGTSTDNCPNGDEPNEVSQPTNDPFFTRNMIVLKNLMKDEIILHSKPGYCSSESVAQAIWMRRTLLLWLKEICDDVHTHTEVLSNAAQLIDRYVKVASVERSIYQLVGATCFFISSKLKEPVPISIEKMIKYTDYSVSRHDIEATELAICMYLGWDLSGISAIDFFMPLIDLMMIDNKYKKILRYDSIQIFKNILHVEHFGYYPPRYIAAACVIQAINLDEEIMQEQINLNFFSNITSIFNLDPMQFLSAWKLLDRCFISGSTKLSKFIADVDSGATEGSLIIPDSVNIGKNVGGILNYIPGSRLQSASFTMHDSSESLDYHSFPNNSDVCLSSLSGSNTSSSPASIPLVSEQTVIPHETDNYLSQTSQDAVHCSTSTSVIDNQISLQSASKDVKNVDVLVADHREKVRLHEMTLTMG